MFRKILIGIGIIVASLVLVWIIGRATGIFQHYEVPSSANQPTLEPGDHIIATKLMPVVRNKLISFTYDHPQFGKQVWVHRCIGMPGDIVEIKNGVTFVNGLNADSTLELSHEYLLTAAEVGDFAQGPESYPLHIGRDSIAYKVPDKWATAHGYASKRFITATNAQDPYVQKAFDKPWNNDHFGPVKVPENSYFVLGDNRHNAMDSRYIGFIHKQAITGVVIGR